MSLVASTGTLFPHFPCAGIPLQLAHRTGPGIKTSNQQITTTTSPSTSLTPASITKETKTSATKDELEEGCVHIFYAIMLMDS